MNILIIANFVANLDGKSYGRFLHLGEILSDQGHQVELITSDFNHGSKKHDRKITGKFKTKVTLLHEPGYPNNVSLKRLYSHYRWGKNVAHYVKKQIVPDIIYLAIPSLTAGVEMVKFCKKRGVKLVVDVQDLWPEAFCMVLKNKLLQFAFKPMEWYVNYSYKNADRVVAVSETYVKRVLQVNKKQNQGLSVFLGNDGALFDSSKEKYAENRGDDKIRIAYVGTLGYSYDIPCVLKALQRVIKKDNDFTARLSFVIMGDGPLRKEFEELTKELNLSEIIEFTGRVPYPEMVGKMCSCDIVVNPIVKGSAASIINKVGDYALSGLPVINTQECQEYRDLIEKYDCGINCRPGNEEEVANAIEILMKNKSLREKLGRNHRKLGIEKFDRRNTYKKIIDYIV